MKITWMVLLVVMLLSACQQEPQTPPSCTDEIISEISPASATLAPGETIQATYRLFSCQRIEGIESTPAWRSVDSSIATVNPTGLISAVAPGKTTIVIDDREHSIVQRIPVTVTSVQIARTKALQNLAP